MKPEVQFAVLVVVLVATGSAAMWFTFDKNRSCNPVAIPVVQFTVVKGSGGVTRVTDEETGVTCYKGAGGSMSCVLTKTKE